MHLYQKDLSASQGKKDKDNPALNASYNPAIEESTDGMLF